MNVQEIISSGRLEGYVAGALDEAEMKEISLAAKQHPELAAEIGKIEAAMMQYYAAGVPAMNKAEMDENLRNIFKAEQNTTPVYNLNTDSKTSKVFSISRWAAAAMISGLVITTALAAIMWDQNSRLKKDVAVIKQQQTELLAHNKKMQQESEALQTRFEMVRHILSKRVELKAVSQKTAPDGYIVMYWNPKTKQVLMADANLPELPADKQYQLWALLDGTQVDLGVFDVQQGRPASAFMKNADNAKGFAVTIEPRGGSKSPTLDNLTVMSNL